MGTNTSFSYVILTFTVINILTKETKNKQRTELKIKKLTANYFLVLLRINNFVFEFEIGISNSRKPKYDFFLLFFHNGNYYFLLLKNQQKKILSI